MFLFGTTQALDDSVLARLYAGGAAEHAERFESAAQSALRAGFTLAEDAEEILALGQLGRQPSGWKRG